MLASLVRRRLWHRLDTIAAFVSLTLGRQLILDHEGVKLVGDHCCVIEMICIRGRHRIDRLEILRVVSHHAQVNRLVAQSLRNATDHSQALGQRHRSHVFAARSIIREACL